MTPAERTLNDLERMEQGFTATRARFWAVVACLVVFYAVAGHLAAVDLGRLATGLPKLWGWIKTAWPPKT